MATEASRTPAHLWIVGIVSALGAMVAFRLGIWAVAIALVLDAHRMRGRGVLR